MCDVFCLIASRHKGRDRKPSALEATTTRLPLPYCYYSGRSCCHCRCFCHCCHCCCEAYDPYQQMILDGLWDDEAIEEKAWHTHMTGKAGLLAVKQLGFRMSTFMQSFRVLLCLQSFASGTAGFQCFEATLNWKAEDPVPRDPNTP